MWYHVTSKERDAGKLRTGFSYTVWGVKITAGKADLQQPDHGMGRGNQIIFGIKALKTCSIRTNLCGSEVRMGQGPRRNRVHVGMKSENRHFFRIERCV